MGILLNDPDFVTTRGPRVATSTGAQVRYTMSADINEHFPTDGSPRTFYNVCRVKAEEKWNFVKAILADVIEGPEIEGSGASMDMGAYDFVAGAAHLYRRNSLIRFDPQQHPIHERAYAVDAVVLTGKGWPVKSPSGELSFRTLPTFPGGDGVGPLERRTPVDGYVDIGVTWKDLPFNVTDFVTDTGDIVDGNTFANHAEQSEICRYCIFKPSVKGNNLQIPGGNIFFIDDDGSIIVNGSRPFLVPESQPFFVPAATFSVMLKMVPRVPLAAAMMQSCVNAYNNIPIPRTIFPRKPDVGTLLYLGYELSDRYYTCSGVEVYDITFAIGYRKGGHGSSTLNRGWNSAYCSKKNDFRRFVSGIYTGGNITRATDGAIIAAAGPDHFTPVTTEASEFGLERITDAGFNAYDFAQIENIFRFEGARIF